MEIKNGNIKEIHQLLNKEKITETTNHRKYLIQSLQNIKVSKNKKYLYENQV